MLFLIATTLFSTAIFILFKLFKQNHIDNLQAIIANYIVASSIGYFAYESQFTPIDIIQAPWFKLSILIGAAFIGVFFLFALSSQKAGIAITAVSSKMSVVIPTAAGFLLFNELLNPQKIIGIILALIALYLALYKKSIDKLPFNIKLIILPLLIFVGTGVNDLLMKIADYYYLQNDVLLLVSTIFAIALIIGLSILIFNLLRGKTKLRGRNFIAGTLLGLVNFGSTYFLFRSLEIFDSSYLFPIRNTGVVGLSALTAFLIFGEKLEKINWLGIILAIIAIVTITTG
ncbi:MAG: EamA/RhaT family transporter [Bacteroidetes bacterium]|jgi:drug/metabolite transporter (DMT)-like permease|nr:EamA/RhaT family transporter [Bacteroidota bacterium]